MTSPAGAPSPTASLPGLDTVLARHGGTATTSDLAMLGATPAQVRRLVARRTLVRVGRGAYVEGALLHGARPHRAHALRALAVGRTWPEGTAVSHDSAALLLQLPVLGRVGLVHGTRTRHGVSRARSGAVLHGGRLHRPPEEISGCPVATAAEAAAGVASLHGCDAAVAVLDAALHRRLQHERMVAGEIPWDPSRLWEGEWLWGRDRPPGTTSMEEVHAVLASRRGHRVAPLLRTAVGLVDPACESVGETRTRLLLWRLGYRVRSQVELRDAVGRLVARVDFALEDEAVAIEFDGMEKYERYGRTPAEDKRRDLAIRDLGFEPVHVGWDHLGHPEAVRRLVEDARRVARAR